MATKASSRPSYAMGIAESTKQDLLHRLARARGQIDGIRRMVEDERYCPDIMQQFAAVHSALHSTEKILLANHLEHCATHALEMGGEPAAQVRSELVELFHRYLR
ncbi:MAG: metal-sensitive transcriptional regulator [Gemmatimonadota bacterium]